MATNTTATSVQHNGNGSTASFAITFAFLANAEVDVTVGGVLKTLGTHYNISGSTVTFTSGNIPPSGTNNIKFQRDTDISAKKVDFQDGSVLTEIDLDTQNDQVLFAQQEILDKLAGVEEGATADQTNAEIKTAYEANSNTNAFTDAEKTKLTNIEASATADQTAAEIRTLVENASDSNVFTDADHSKLNAIEAGATADQTNAEIRAAVEAASDSNVFTDADHTKLNGIEAGATADQSNAEIKTAYEANSNTNAFTDAEKTKLTGIETGATADQTNAEIRAAVEAATDSNVFTDADHSKLNAIEASATADQTDAEIKTAYENNSDTNAFTDAEKTKLTSVESNADVTDATNVDAAGAVMNSDLDGKGELLVGDGSGDPSALAVGQNGYILTADSTEATGVKWAANSGGGGGSGISDVVSDTTPQLGGNLDVQTNEITTSTSNGNIKLNPNGTGVVEVKGDGSSADGTIQLNCSQNSHGVKIKSPPHSANASYTLTLPNTDGNANQVLKTDGSGGLDWVDQTTDTNTQLSNAQVRSAVEAASDSNVFTDADHSKLDGIEASATADQTASEIVALVADQTIAPSTIDMEDNEIIKLGTGDDLQIYHNGTNSIIDNNTGILSIQGDDVRIQNSAGGEAGFRFIADGAVELYHDNIKRLQTTSLGIEVTSGEGETAGIYLTADEGDDNNDYWRMLSATTAKLLIQNYASGSWETSIECNANGNVELYYDNSLKAFTYSDGFHIGSGTLRGDDNAKVVFGDSSDLQIYHDGSHSYIKDAGTGFLYIDSDSEVISRTDSFTINNAANSENMLYAVANGGVHLYYDSSKKFETTNLGAKTTGNHTFESGGGNAYFATMHSNGSTRFYIYDYPSASTVQIGTYTSSHIDFLTSGTQRVRIQHDGHVVPYANDTYNLGSSNLRWANVYTNDLNLSNEGGSNDVDGTWGSFTIQEGAEDLFLINKRNGKKYKFNLTEVS